MTPPSGGGVIRSAGCQSYCEEDSYSFDEPLADQKDATAK